MTKQERIIEQALKNPTPKNVKALAALTKKLLANRKRLLVKKRKAESELRQANGRFMKHDWDVATGRV